MNDDVINEILLEPDLSNSEKVLMLILLMESDKNSVEISLKKIADKANTSKRTIISIIGKLVEKGVLNKEKRMDSDNGNLSNRYTIKTKR